MKRGTALKLTDLLKSGNYTAGTCVLRYENCYCVFGVLADFLDPEAWRDGFAGDAWRGCQHYLDDAALKQCKIKTRDGVFIDDEDRTSSLVQQSDLCARDGKWDKVIVVLEKYYDQI